MKKNFAQEEVLLVTSSGCIRREVGRHNYLSTFLANGHIPEDKLQETCRNGFFNKWSWSSLIRNTPERMPLRKLFITGEMVCAQISERPISVENHYSIYPYLLMQVSSKYN